MEPAGGGIRLGFATLATDARIRPMNALRWILIMGSLVALAIGLPAWLSAGPKRIARVEPGRIIRGAWQSPEALREVAQQYHIKTIVSLTAINADDSKYVGQAEVVEDLGLGWRIVPMRGSRATLAQMAEAADLVADPDLQPIFFHCVAGHHRSSLVQAAYRIRHQGWSADEAWNELRKLNWTRPEASADRQDAALIVEFAASPYAHKETPCVPSEDERSFSGLALRSR